MDILLKILFAMICIVAILFMAYYLTKIYAKKMGTVFGAGENIRVIDRMPVGKGSSIAIVELRDKQYLLGITEENITLIDTLEGIDRIKKVDNSSLPEINIKGSFKTLLQKEKGEDDANS